MIRGRDQIRLSVQKLALRKKRATFSVISVALGVIVVVAVNSLIENIRDLLVRTTFTEEIDKDVIRIYATNNPYEVVFRRRDKPDQPKKRFQFLTEAALEQMRAWPEVVAAERPILVSGLGFDAFRNQLRPVWQATGVPEALMRRYVREPALWAAASNALPLVVGERIVRLAYDEKTKRVRAASTNEVRSWIGRPITVTLGDPFAGLPAFSYDSDKKQWQPLGEDEQASRREIWALSYRERFDPVLFNTTLSLRAVVVGFCPGHQVLMPLDTATLCEKWLKLRAELADLWPAQRNKTVEYGARGRATPREGEFTEGLLVLKEGADAETVARRIEEMGFQATTRTSAFESMVAEFDTAVRFVKRVAWAFGGMILALAAGLLWSTTSRIVSDSRADIGLFRALGATKSDVRRLFLGEAALLGMLGTLVGVLLGWATAWQISRWVVRLVQSEVSDPEQMLLVPDSVFRVDATFCLMLLAGAAVFSILVGLWPANRAASVDPVQALKRE